MTRRTPAAITPVIKRHAAILLLVTLILMSACARRAESPLIKSQPSTAKATHALHRDGVGSSNTVKLSCDALTITNFTDQLDILLDYASITNTSLPYETLLSNILCYIKALAEDEHRQEFANSLLHSDIDPRLALFAYSNLIFMVKDPDESFQCETFYAICMAKMGKYENAYNHLIQHIATRPKSTLKSQLFRFSLLHCLCNAMNKYDDAFTYAENAQLIAQKLSNAMLKNEADAWLAGALINIGDYKRAADIYSQLIDSSQEQSERDKYVRMRDKCQDAQQTESKAFHDWKVHYTMW